MPQFGRAVRRDVVGASPERFPSTRPRWTCFRSSGGSRRCPVVPSRSAGHRPRGRVRAHGRRLLRCSRSAGRRAGTDRRLRLSKAPAEDESSPGEVIVKLEDGASLDAVARATACAQGAHGLRQGVRRSSSHGTRATSARWPRARRRSRRRVRGAELHPPRRRDRLAAVGVLQPGRAEHEVLQRPERTRRADSRRRMPRSPMRTRTTSRATPPAAPTSRSARSTPASTSLIPEFTRPPDRRQGLVQRTTATTVRHAGRGTRHAHDRHDGRQQRRRRRRRRARRRT